MNVEYKRKQYKRYTNFSCDTLEYPSDINFGKKEVIVLKKNADLFGKMTLETTLPKLSDNRRWVSHVGLALIKRVTVTLCSGYDEEVISDVTGEYLYLRKCLELSDDMKNEYDELIGHGSEWGPDSKRIYIPFDSWFDRPDSHGNLISCPYQNIEVTIELEDLSKLIQMKSTTTRKHLSISLRDTKLLLNAVYLDTKERKRIMEMDQRYVIDQIQVNRHKIDLSDNRVGVKNTMIDMFNQRIINLDYNVIDIISSYFVKDVMITLDLMHKCEDMIWIVEKPTVLSPLKSNTILEDRQDPPNSFGHVNVLDHCSLIIDDKIRYCGLSSYFTKTLPYKHFNKISNDIHYLSLRQSIDFSNNNKLCIQISDKFKGCDLNIRIYTLNKTILRYKYGKGEIVRI